MIEIRKIPKHLSLTLIQKFHYSNTLPSINKIFLWYYIDWVIKWTITLWYGTRPLHTINLLFEDVNVDEYLEIWRMCMDEDMPRNSESQMISLLIKRLRKNIPKLKVLFTWADGMMGKPWYVYQACSFEYCWYSRTDTYYKNWMKIHPRQIKHLLDWDRKDQIWARPTKKQMIDIWLKQYKWKQFKYAKILRKCKKLYNTLPYPKHIDLEWYVKSSDWWDVCEKPEFTTDTINSVIKNKASLF